MPTKHLKYSEWLMEVREYITPETPYICWLIDDYYKDTKVLPKNLYSYKEYRIKLLKSVQDKLRDFTNKYPRYKGLGKSVSFYHLLREKHKEFPAAVDVNPYRKQWLRKLSLIHKAKGN